MRPLTVLVLLVLLVPPVQAFHASPSADDEVDVLEGSDQRTWREVTYYPSGDHALVVGGYEEDNRSYSLIARWTPSEGLEEVYNRSGPPLVDVDIREDGTSIAVGLRNTILVGEPGAYRNVWNDSRFAGEDKDLTFYGLGAAFAPDDDYALVSGSSLLRVEQDGSLEVLHSGEGAFFRSIDFNPVAGYALVEAAVEQDGQPVLGTVWRTDGESNLTRDDNVAIYGRFSRANALLNTISFAPNGTFALFGGRDGSGASFMTWSPDRPSCHDHPNASACHDHTYRFMGTPKQTGPVTCADWHPSGRYALVTGLEDDVVGFANTRMWAPIMHQGPQLLGCAFSPNGTTALAVGENGTVAEITPDSTPLVRVLDPKPGRLARPETEQSFLVGVLHRDERSPTTVTGHVAGTNQTHQAAPRDPWWTLSVNVSQLEDGNHDLVVNASTSAGQASLAFPFLVNNEAFAPETPVIQSPTGLEGKNRDSNGLFTIRWQPVEGPVVYEIHERRVGETASNATEIIQAGSTPNATVRVHSDGTYFYKVRATNTYEASNWTEEVSVEVVLDSDGDGVPDKRDPQPRTPNEWGDPDDDGIATNVELNQCSDPFEANSTPTSDDDGDGIPNGIECEQGTDPRDADDPGGPDEEPTEPNETQNNTTDEPLGGRQDSPAPGAVLLLGLVGLAALLRRRET